jgi:hypothetical protein
VGFVGGSRGGAGKGGISGNLRVRGSSAWKRRTRRGCAEGAKKQKDGERMREDGIGKESMDRKRQF